MKANSNRDGPVVAAGLLLGVGLGGFVDGILMHQLLQWHNMLSSRLPPVDLVSIKTNMLWDGLFHAFTWLTTVAGVVVLWRAAQKRVPLIARTFVGALLAGWGVFNVVEGLIDHQLLGLHHVRPGEAQLAWDVGFLVLGVVLVAIGYALVRSGRRRQPRVRPVGTAPVGHMVRR